MAINLIGKVFSYRSAPHHRRVFSLYVLCSFIAVFATTLVLSSFLSNYVTHQMIMREAAVSTDVLNSFAIKGDVSNYFVHEHPGIEDLVFDEFFTQLASIKDVFRANVFSADGEIIWSTTPQLIGMNFLDNKSLDVALAGEIEPHLWSFKEPGKEEHVGFPPGIDHFLEYYMPVWSTDGTIIIGALEVYKAPRDLFAQLDNLNTLAWAGGAIAGTVLFAALMLVVNYASRVLKRQEQRVIEAEKLAVVGEMASAVAHGLRNPLAAIRSCAELVAEDKIPRDSREVVLDIVDQVDRLEGWIRSFLVRSQSSGHDDIPAESQIDQVVQRCIDNFRPQIDQRRINLVVEPSARVGAVAATAAEFEQLLNAILSNAVEAMKQGGNLYISWEPKTPDTAVLSVRDSGPGLPEDALTHMFEPFHSGKTSGLGIGLSLAHRIAQRLGGSLALNNHAAGGAIVKLELPCYG